MENLIPNDPLDPREKFFLEIETQGRKYTWVAQQLQIARSTLSDILNCRQPLSDERRKKLNELLGTNI